MIKKDYTGLKIGHLFVVKSVGVRNYGKHNEIRITTWKCKCDCGSFTYRYSGQLSNAIKKNLECICCKTCPKYSRFWQTELERAVANSVWHLRHRDKNSIKIRNKSIRDTVKFLIDKARKNNFLCPISGRKITENNVSIGHIVPKSRGGSDLHNNLRLEDKYVNIAKQNMNYNDFIVLCRDCIKYFKKAKRLKQF